MEEGKGGDTTGIGKGWWKGSEEAPPWQEKDRGREGMRHHWDSRERLKEGKG